MRRLSGVLIATALLVAACGDDDEPTEATEAPSTEAPATDPPATDPPPTDPPATDPPATDPPPTEAPAPDPGAIAVSLVEWEVIAPDTYEAGTITFQQRRMRSRIHWIAVYTVNGG